MSTETPQNKPRFRLHPVALLNSERLRISLRDTYGQKGFYKYVIGIILLILSIGSLFYTDILVEELEQREEREGCEQNSDHFAKGWEIQRAT